VCCVDDDAIANKRFKDQSARAIKSFMPELGIKINIDTFKEKRLL